MTIWQILSLIFVAPVGFMFLGHIYNFFRGASITFGVPLGFFICLTIILVAFLGIK